MTNNVNIEIRRGAVNKYTLIIKVVILIESLFKFNSQEHFIATIENKKELTKCYKV